MLARCGRVLLRRDGAARGFERLGVLGDAFDLVDDRFAGALRAAVKSIQGIFTVTRDVRLSDDGLATWCDTFRTLTPSSACRAPGRLPRSRPHRPKSWRPIGSRTSRWDRWQA
jgi:hypothetical protein